MLEAQNPPIDLHRNEETIQSVEPEEMSGPKQQVKKPLLTPYRIIIGVAIFLILVMATYKVYSLASSKTIDQINDAHNKYIQNGDSSSGKDSGSVSGSQSSKNSKNSDKSNGIAKPAGKDTISSNTNTGGFGKGEGEDEDDDEEDSNEENRRKKLMDKNKSDGASTEEESESIEEDSEEEDNGGMVWTPAQQGGAMPGSVGGIRD